jgi:uncharacterized membrane protein
MSFHAIPGVAMRWIHIICAALIIGGVFFMRIVVPYGLAVLPADAREQAFLRMRRIFKIVVHSGIALLLLSGSYNTWVNLPTYHAAGPLSHSLLGVHILLALTAFTIALVLLAGPRPPVSHRKWLAVNLVVLALLVAAASSLKTVRERALKQAAAAQVAAQKR